jgi:hypothetical protein
MIIKIKHLCNPCSPKETIQLNNPNYIESPEQYDGSFITLEELEAMYGDSIYSPTYPFAVASLTYCNQKCIRKPLPKPDLFWEAVNYIAPQSIIECPENEVCWDCVAILDKIRHNQGYRPVVDYLQNPNDCQCAVWVLQNSGCRCQNKI